MSPIDTPQPSEGGTTPPEQSTGEQPAHKHSISSAERAVVVGKCLKGATGANQVIEILVDIAG